jgi:hypothetical protein
MMKPLWRGAVLIAALMVLAHPGLCADAAADVEQVLREVRQDAPVPSLGYLHLTESINAGCAYYRGKYRGIEVTVETHPNSNRVASILLKLAGPDQTRLILPAVSRVIGPPHSSDLKHSTYSWNWPEYRTASVHYAGGGRESHGLTIVSIFYR